MWNVDHALTEIDPTAGKSLQAIQKETAYVWGSRALAALVLFRAGRGDHMLGDALEYAHEAIEHAALAGPDVYLEVRGMMSDVLQYT